MTTYQNNQLTLTPEQKARKIIDSLFSNSGWEVVDRDSYSPTTSAAAIEEGLLNHNLEADYLLFINGTAIGFLTEKANFLVFFLRKITILWGWVFLAMARCQ